MFDNIRSFSEADYQVIHFELDIPINFLMEKYLYLVILTIGNLMMNIKCILIQKV